MQANKEVNLNTAFRKLCPPVRSLTSRLIPRGVTSDQDVRSPSLEETNTFINTADGT